MTVGSESLKRGLFLSRKPLVASDFFQPDMPALAMFWNSVGDETRLDLTVDRLRNDVAAYQISGLRIRTILDDVSGHGRGNAGKGLQYLFGSGVDVDRVVLWIMTETVSNAKSGTFDVAGNSSRNGSRGAADNILAPRA